MNEYSAVDEPFTEDLIEQVPVLGVGVALSHGPEPKYFRTFLIQKGVMYYNPLSDQWWKYDGTVWEMHFPEV